MYFQNVHIKLIHVHVLDFKFYILNYFVYRNMHIEVFQKVTDHYVNFMKKTIKCSVNKYIYMYCYR